MLNMSMSELLKLAIAQGKMPCYLYKYTTADNAIRAIEDGTVYFAQFSQFNDEYEGFANLDTSFSSQDWANFLVQNGIFGWEASFLMTTVKTNPAQAAEIIKKTIEENQNNNGFFCLTPNPNNVLMWAHYADQNKGCCLGYDLLADTELFSHIRKVEYGDNTIAYNYLHNNGGAMDAMFHKSKHWEYEDEYRVIWINQHGARKVKDGSLCKIIFGSKIDVKKEGEIKVKIKGMKVVPDLFRAVKGDNPKEMDIVAC